MTLLMLYTGTRILDSHQLCSVLTHYLPCKGRLTTLGDSISSGQPLLPAEVADSCVFIPTLPDDAVDASTSHLTTIAQSGRSLDLSSDGAPS